MYIELECVRIFGIMAVGFVLCALAAACVLCMQLCVADARTTVCRGFYYGEVCDTLRMSDACEVYEECEDGYSVECVEDGLEITEYTNRDCTGNKTTVTRATYENCTQVSLDTWYRLESCKKHSAMPDTQTIGLAVSVTTVCLVLLVIWYIATRRRAAKKGSRHVSLASMPLVNSARDDAEYAKMARDQ